MKENILKRTFITLLTMVLIISLVGCSGSSSNEEKNVSVIDDTYETSIDNTSNNDGLEDLETISETKVETVKATESGNVLAEKLGGEDYTTGKGTTVDFGSVSIDREEITSITVLSSLSDMPEETSDVFVGDVSEAQDGSVMAWAVPNAADASTYALYIAGEGGVDAGTSCKDLFEDFYNVVSIEFNNCFYTGNTIDMEGMFNGNCLLQELDLSCFVTDNVNDMSEMFYNCRALTNLSMDDWNTSNVVSMYSMFEFCGSLTELNIGDWDTSAVEDMGVMFSMCSSLEELSIGDWDVSKVNSMGQMFFYCSSLKSLDISGWDTSNVWSMKAMFNGCTSLLTLDISDWNVSNCVYMDNMFKNCSNEIIPDWYK